VRELKRGHCQNRELTKHFKGRPKEVATRNTRGLQQIDSQNIQKENKEKNDAGKRIEYRGNPPTRPPGGEGNKDGNCRKESHDPRTIKK